jgi:alanine racemase
MLRKLVKKSLSHLSTNNYQTLNHIELSQTNTLSNVELLASEHPGYSIITVLKANAYGHGLIEMTKILNKAKLSFIAIDGYFEAAKIRDISKHKLLVMGYIKPDNMKLIDTKRCSFVIQDIAGLSALAKLKKPVHVHMELNTGMNRLGLAHHEIPGYLKFLKTHPNLILEGVMTHLADADNERSDSFNDAQVAQFDKTVEEILSAGFSPDYIHIAQTAGSTKANSKYANAIRLGIGLYGINPLSISDAKFSSLNKLKPVLQLQSTIIKCIDLKKGDRVSYNGIFTAPKSMRIGILPLGYYEGIPRELSNKGMVSYASKPLKIVGRVCMNHTMIDITDTNLEVGSEITVLNADKSMPNSVAQISLKYDLFSYTLATGLSSSVRRIVV